MNERKFKTSAKCNGCVAAIGEKLNTVMSPDQWNIDLTSPNRTLTVTASDVPDSKIIELVSGVGFKIERMA